MYCRERAKKELRISVACSGRRKRKHSLRVTPTVTMKVLLDLDIQAKGIGVREAKSYSGHRHKGSEGLQTFLPLLCSTPATFLCFSRHLGMAGHLDYQLEFPLYGTGCKEIYKHQFINFLWTWELTLQFCFVFPAVVCLSFLGRLKEVQRE